MTAAGPSAGELAGRGAVAACAVLLAAAAIAAYSGTFGAPFLFDDAGSVVGNDSLRSLAAALAPPVGATVSGRPILNLSFAVSRALCGDAPWGFHACNLAILIGGSLALFGIVRRTLSVRAPSRATAAALAVAALWSLHPLLTESVTYVVQRAESLMGLFYLLTLYCFIRGAAAAGRTGLAWFVLSAGCCLLGMGTKEVMVTAPLLALLYDRTFLAGSFAGALRLRGRVYAGLAATWAVLPFLVMAAHGRGGTAGFGAGESWWRYAAAQPAAIIHYLRLSVWPRPLVFDYGSGLAPFTAQAAAACVLVAAVLAAVGWALVRRPAAGFLGAAFFILLAPSSSFVPVATEAMAEHRMYLPLAVVMACIVLAVFRWLGRAAVPACVAVAVVLMALTWSRNRAYVSEESIWADTVAHRPQNPRAQDNLGFALSRIPGRTPDAILHYEEALRLKPDFVDAHYNLAYALIGMPGRTGDAVLHYEEALRLKPNLPEVQYNLARALESLPGRSAEAQAHYAEAVRLRPSYADAHYNLGCLLLAEPKKQADAASQFRETIRLRPSDAHAHYNLGRALEGIPGSEAGAEAEFRETVRLSPDFAEAHYSLGAALQSKPGPAADAAGEFREAIRLRPNFAQAHFALGFALESLGKPAEAAAEYEEAVRLDPSNASAHFNRGNVLEHLGRPAESIAEFEAAVRLDPANVAARCNLGSALGAAGRNGEAVEQYEAAVRQAPGEPAIRLNLAIILLKAPGHEAQAREQLAEALRLNPSSEEARRILAEIGPRGSSPR